MSKPAVLKERESDILRTILDGLAAKRIWAMRMNSGLTIASYGGKTRAIRYGRRGCADILALPLGDYDHAPTWIECKTATGKQSADQAAFEKEVTAEGHRYLLVRSWDELLEKL